jgi:phage shock protein C
LSVNSRLYRSVDDRVIAGVCGGLADRLDLDPALVRIGYAVLAIVTGVAPFLILYVIMAIVVPEEPEWTGVRPVPGGAWNAPAAATTVSAPWQPVEPVAPAGEGASPPGEGLSTAGAAVPDGEWSTGEVSTIPITPGLPPAPDAVPGWVQPGSLGPRSPQAWAAGAPGWSQDDGGFGPTDRRSSRRADRAARRMERDARRAARRDDPAFAILAGIFLVGLGAFFRLRNAFSIDWQMIWPAIVVTLGVLLVIAALLPRRRGGG